MKDLKAVLLLAELALRKDAQKLRLSRPACLVALLASVCAVGPAIADARLRLPEPPIAIRDMQVVAYSKTFADRFNLPAPDARLQTRAPLHALRLSMEVLHIDPVLEVPTFGCNLQVYIDKDLPFAYPVSAKTWARDLYGPLKHRWLQSKPGQARSSDHLHLTEQELLSYELIALASANFEWNKRGWFGTHALLGFDRELIPGFAYLEVGLLCPRPRVIQSGLPPELWLKKPIAASSQTRRMDLQAFEKLPLPPAFLESAVQWLAWHEARTSVAGDERARMERNATGGAQQR